VLRLIGREFRLIWRGIQLQCGYWSVQSDRFGSDRTDRIWSDRSDLQAHTGLVPINWERAPINQESGFCYNVDIDQFSQIGQIRSDQIGQIGSGRTDRTYRCPRTSVIPMCTAFPVLILFGLKFRGTVGNSNWKYSLLFSASILFSSKYSFRKTGTFWVLISWHYWDIMSWLT